MCFRISQDAGANARWANKHIVWKCFRVTTKYKHLYGPHYPRLYRLGEVKVRDPGPSFIINSFHHTRQAKHGIYVYDTKAMALAEAKHQAIGSRAKFVAVRCSVDPMDLLHVSDRQSIYTGAHSNFCHGYAATYHKIKPLEIVK